MSSIVYISGPISLGETASESQMQTYKLRFDRAEATLRAMGLDVRNSLENPEGLSWQEYMRRNIRKLTECDGIYMLPDWQLSKGAVLELYIASVLGLHILFAEYPR